MIQSDGKICRKKGIGTIAYRDSWDLFDQMILSEPFLKRRL
ncbi:hypothetical protein ACFSO9_13580 [Mesonia maritima]